ILLLGIFTVNFSTAQMPDINSKIENDGSILLPAQKQASDIGLTANPHLMTKTWVDFINQNPGWNIFFNEMTGKPHRAFGKPIQINGFSVVNEDNIKDAAAAFIEQNETLFGFDISTLKLRRTTNVNNLWSVSYSQVYKGVEVLLTEIELRIRPDGKVMAFGIDYYDDIDIDVNPVLSREAIQDRAAEGLSFDNKNDIIQSSGKTFIIPVKTQNIVNFNLVSEVTVDMPSTNQKFSTYVDLHDGEIVWRRNMIANVETQVDVKGGVKLVSRLSPVTIENFGNFKFNVGGITKTTDKDGVLFIDIDQPTYISSNIEGSWAKVDYSEIPNGFFEDTIRPGEPFTLLWTDNNSHLFERTLYYHANYAHEFYKTIDPISEAMDFQIKVTIYNQGQPNAGSDLENGDISFVGALNSSLYVVESPTILYHEYGHSINTRLYRELGIPQGMVNMACHEATADLNAAFMTDQPKIGYLAFSDTLNTIRNLVNTRKYPRDVINESHNDGLILGGAYWDLRLATDLDYIRWLVHYTKKMGTPDDADIGIAFAEWFIETLITDDNYGEGDNDLSNGTPHAELIIESFNKHNIGTNLALMLSFNHEPFGDTQDIENPYKIEFELSNSLTFIDNKPQEVTLHYSTNDFKTKEEIPAVEVSAGNYEAEIPAQQKGTIVKYYMSANDDYSSQKIYLSADLIDYQPYVFLVGYKVGLLEDFENALGWTFGADTDDATYGQWELAVPQPASLNFGNGELELQPGSDHSSDGTKCLVTGASNGGGTLQGIMMNMPNGTTTVISPTYNITNTERPLLSYYKFYSNVPLFQGVPLSKWKTYISSNGGETWIVIENTDEESSGWQRVVYPINDVVSRTNKFRIKFEFLASPNQGYTLIMSEGLVDDLEILTANDEANITEVDENIHSGLSLFPNPFTESINILLECEPGENINISVYDILGNKVSTIADGFVKSVKSGFLWDGKDLNGNIVPKGLYLLKMVSGDKIITEKIILN
ncbi:T9SS type A sorting domain-containing protein, partial [Bacteroidota bacterium]